MLIFLIKLSDIFLHINRIKWLSLSEILIYSLFSLRLKNRSNLRFKVTHFFSSQSPIGIFDSGIGGTTVLRKLTQMLPNEKILYFGDTARLPYGDKTPAQILHYSTAILNWMASQGVKMVLMGCNTSSALAYPHLVLAKKPFDFRVLDIIRPFAESLATDKKTIGIFATAGTVRSEMHKKIIHAHNPDIKVLSVSCPEWVSIIENGHIQQADTLFHVKKYVEPILEQGADALLYGCTHYPLLEKVLRQAIPDYLSHIELIDPADHIVNKAIEYLTEHNLLNQDTMRSAYTRFYATGDTKAFAHNIEKLWGYKPEVGHVDLPLPETSLFS